MSKVFRSAGIISFLTLVSRILGLIRDVVSASIFGTGVVYDAFLIAFVVPNLFRKLLGEGAISAAFIPVYTDYLEAGDSKKTQAFLNAVFSALLTVLLVIAVAGALGTGVLGSRLAAPGKWNLALRLLPTMILYVVPICLVGFAAGVLNSHRHFAMPAFAPIVLNVFWIAALFAAYGVSSGPSGTVVILVGAVFMAGITQFAIQLPVLRSKGVRLRFRPDFSHPGVKSVRALMAPVIFGLAIFQINTFLDSLIAMTLVREEGGVSVLYYANRLIQFPLALIGIAVATAVFPTLTSLAAGGKREKFAATFKEAVLGVLYLAVPAAVGLAVLSVPVVRLIFEYGRFDPSSTRRTSFALVCYAATVACASVYHVVTRAFYSMKDTRTPVKVGAFMVGLNLVLNLTLVWPLQEAGLALATSISSAVNVLVLLAILHRRHEHLDLASLGRGFARFSLVSGVMGIAAYGVLALLPAGNSVPQKLVCVVVPVAAGAAVVLVMSALLKFPEFSFMLKAIRRRGRTQNPRG